MNYANYYLKENNYVSINTLVKPQKKRELNVLPRSAAGTPQESIQAKQNLNPVDSSAELEANQMAAAVSRMSEDDLLWKSKDLPKIAPGNGTGFKRPQTAIMAKECTECKNKTIANDMLPDIQSRVKNHISSCPGKPLSKNARNFFEEVFKRDFGGVRVHTCNDSIQMNQDLNSQAFTYQNHIFFNKDKYNPDSQEGKELLAHELTHVVQNEGKAEEKIQTFKIPFTEYLELPDIYIEPIPHTHPLEPCVSQPITHIGVVIRKKGPQSTGKGKISFDLHIGFYKDNVTGKICFVMFESKTRFCFKICLPNWDDIKAVWEKIRDTIADALKALFAAIGIVVAAWILYLIAEAIATALMALLAAIAVA